MRFWQRCLLASLLLNLSLAAIALVLKQRVSPIPSVAPAKRVLEQIANEQPSDKTMTNNVAVTNAFSWDQIESTDFPTFIANLRAIGCPERTIADIITADMEELYERKGVLVPLEARFWETESMAHPAWRKRVEEQLQLEREKTLMLQQLLGTTWFGYAKSDAYDISIAQFLSGILDERRAAQLVARVDRLKADRNLLERGRLDIILPEDQLRDKALLQEYLTDLSGLFSGSEMAELKMRNVCSGVVNKISAFSVLAFTPAEAQQICRLSVEALRGGLIPMDHSNSKIPELLAHNESFQDQVRALLGESRYTLYKIAQAQNFGEIYSFVDENNLPAALSFEISQLSITAENEAKELRDNLALPDNTRAAALKEVRQRIERQVGRLVGTNQPDFLKRNESWLKQLEGQ